MVEVDEGNRERAVVPGHALHLRKQEGEQGRPVGHMRQPVDGRPLGGGFEGRRDVLQASSDRGQETELRRLEVRGG